MNYQYDQKTPYSNDIQSLHLRLDEMDAKLNTMMEMMDSKGFRKQSLSDVVFMGGLVFMLSTFLIFLWVVALARSP